MSLSLTSVGLTRCCSSETIDKLAITSRKANVLAVSCNLNTLSLRIALILQNKSYSKSIILSSAFKIKASFSFNSGEIKRSAPVKVCLLSQPIPSGILSTCPLVTSIK